LPATLLACPLTASASTQFLLIIARNSICREEYHTIYICMNEKQVMNFDHRQSITSRTTQSTFRIKLLLITSQSVTSAKKKKTRCANVGFRSPTEQFILGR